MQIYFWVLEEQSDEVKHRFKGVYNVFVRLKSYLVEHFGYFEPAIFYHDPSVDAWLALNTDDELQHAHEAATRLPTSAWCIRIRVVVASFGVAVLHGHDDSQMQEADEIKACLPAQLGYAVTSHSNDELFSERNLSAAAPGRFRILHFATHGSSRGGAQQHVGADIWALPSDELKKKMAG